MTYNKSVIIGATLVNSHSIIHSAAAMGCDVTDASRQLLLTEKEVLEIVIVKALAEGTIDHRLRRKVESKVRDPETIRSRAGHEYEFFNQVYALAVEQDDPNTMTFSGRVGPPPYLRALAAYTLMRREEKGLTDLPTYMAHLENSTQSRSSASPAR